MTDRQAGETVRKLCPSCGKPVASGRRPGSLTSFLFGASNCACLPGGNQPKADNSAPLNEDAEDIHFCPKCGLEIVTAPRDGSLTGFMFQSTRCKCPPDKDFADGQMSSRFWKLKQSGSSTIFASSGDDEKRTSRSKTTVIDLAPGATIGGVYTVIKLLGLGGMGEVYLARHETLGKKCALKVIPPEQVTEMGWQRFQLEAKAVAKLEHINLVRVTDLGIHDGCLPFYAMEFVDGINLADMLAEAGPLALSAVLDIFMQVCDGVDCAHRNGILHRDLKPANIMVLPETSGHRLVKILDFGLAKLTSHDQTKQSLTAVGDIFGSPFYMSPEQCNGEKLDRRSDIYSIGCAMFECLTGQPPFTGHQPAAVMFSHAEADPPSLESIGGKGRYPASLEIVIAKILRKNPVERYQTFLELRSDLEKVARGEDVEPFYVSRGVRDREGERAAASRESLTDKTDRVAFPLKSVIIGTVVFTIVTGVSALVYFTCAKPVAPEVAKKTDAKVGFARWPELNTKVSAQAPPVSSRDSTPYSHISNANGRAWRIFNFPTDVTIGYVRTAATKPHLATGVVTFPADAKIKFTPAPIAIKYPALLKRFRSGDINTVIIDLYFNTEECGGINAIIDALLAISGLEEFNSESEDEVDDHGLESILKMDTLQRLRIYRSKISEQNLPKLSRLKQLKIISISSYKTDVTALLTSLAGSTRLTQLTLSGGRSALPGIASLATVPNLTSLSLERLVPSNPESTGKALKLLSKCPELISISIHTLPMQLGTVEALEPFKNPTVLDIRPEKSGTSSTLAAQIVRALHQREGYLKLRTVFVPTGSNGD